MAFDLERAVRRVERQTGATITIAIQDGGVPGVPVAILHVVDPELGGRMEFFAHLGPRSKLEQQVKALHEDIYRSHAREKHRMQGAKCAKCGKDLGLLGETNHIKHRGRNGRDDRLSNLEVVCPPFSGGCSWHRQEHGERVKG